jgi:8-oxo-dGTP pyrophosphatase MutT (NUDIX family)/predicted nucleotidyltransferase
MRPDLALPDEVREVAEQLIATLGDDLAAVYWHGSWARGEAKPWSDHDLLIVLHRLDDPLLTKLRDVFRGRKGWSTFVRTEEELRQYPSPGRPQWHFGLVPIFGELVPPTMTNDHLIEELRMLALNISFEARYRLLHREPLYDEMEQHWAGFLRQRTARMLRYAAKQAIMAMKARELLEGRDYPAALAALRPRLTDPAELALLDLVEHWDRHQSSVEANADPLALQLDAFARNLVTQLETLAPSAFPLPSSPVRHNTATAFVVRDNATLLHWHKRVQQWMPPGGHIEPNEDPVQAALREVREETGLICEIIPTSPTHDFAYPQQLPAPYTILVEDIPGPGEPHKHIDMIYFVRPIVSAQHDTVDDPTLRWVTEAELRANAPLDVAGCGVTAAIPEDVRQLALAAIAAAK